MKLLFDQGTPAPLRGNLHEHIVDTLAEKSWSDKDNEEWLDLAEREGYEAFVTTDQKLHHQQNLTGRQIGIVVLLATACQMSASARGRFARPSPWSGRAR